MSWKYLLAWNLCLSTHFTESETPSHGSQSLHTTTWLTESNQEKTSQQHLIKPFHHLWSPASKRTTNCLYSRYQESIQFIRLIKPKVYTISLWIPPSNVGHPVAQWLRRTWRKNMKSGKYVCSISIPIRKEINLIPNLINHRRIQDGLDFSPEQHMQFPSISFQWWITTVACNTIDAMRDASISLQLYLPRRAGRLIRIESATFPSMFAILFIFFEWVFGEWELSGNVLKKFGFIFRRNIL